MCICHNEYAICAVGTGKFKRSNYLTEFTEGNKADESEHVGSLSGSSTEQKKRKGSSRISGERKRIGEQEWQKTIR